MDQNGGAQRASRKICASEAGSPEIIWRPGKGQFRATRENGQRIPAIGKEGFSLHQNAKCAAFCKWWTRASWGKLRRLVNGKKNHSVGYVIAALLSIVSLPFPDSTALPMSNRKRIREHVEYQETVTLYSTRQANCSPSMGVTQDVSPSPFGYGLAH